MQNMTCIVKAIIVHNYKFLVLVRSRDGLLDLPGGHLEVGEGVEQGLIREVREETQLEVKNLDADKSVDSANQNTAFDWQA